MVLIEIPHAFCKLGSVIVAVFTAWSSVTKFVTETCSALDRGHQYPRKNCQTGDRLAKTQMSGCCKDLHNLDSHIELRIFAVI